MAQPSPTLLEKLHQPGKWSEADARKIMAAHQRSGLSIHAFARTHELAPHKLYWWRNRLEELGDTQPVLSFAPVVVTGLGRRPALTVRLSALELDVHEPSKVEPAWLAQICVALSSEAE